MLTPAPGVHLRMLLLGMSANMRYPDCIQTGPSVQVKPVATFSSLVWEGMIMSRAGSNRSIVGTIALDAVVNEPVSELAPFGLELPGGFLAVATNTEMLMIAIELIIIVRKSFFRVTPSPPNSPKDNSSTSTVTLARSIRFRTVLVSETASGPESVQRRFYISWVPCDLEFPSQSQLFGERIHRENALHWACRRVARGGFGWFERAWPLIRSQISRDALREFKSSRFPFSQSQA